MVGPPASLCLSEEQTYVSKGTLSKSLGESTEDSSLTEKEMSVLEAIKKSGDQGDGKDTAIASSTGESQMLLMEVSVMHGTLPLDTSVGTYAKKEELFVVHTSSEEEQFPTLFYIKVEELSSQTPTEDHESYIKTFIEDEESLAHNPGKKEELLSQTYTGTAEFLVLTPACKEELSQTHIEIKEFSSQVHIEKEGYPVQAHLKKAKLPAQTCIMEELPTHTQIETMKEEVPAQTVIDNRELFAQPQTGHLHEAECLFQTWIEEEGSPVEKVEFPVQTHAEETSQNHTNEHEKDLEEVKLPVKVAGSDLVVKAVAQLSEENKSTKEVHRVISEHADGNEFVYEEGQESLAPLNQKECIGPDEKHTSTDCERQTPTKKSLSFCEDVKSFSYKPRENLKMNIYESFSSPMSKQEQARLDESQLTAAVQLVSPCEEDRNAKVLQEVEVENVAGYENSIPLLSKTIEDEKSEIEYGQKDEHKVEVVPQEVPKMEQEVNTVSSTALQT